jgi:hypothetical protein
MRDIRWRMRVVVNFPDRLLGADAGYGETQAHSRDEVG